MRLALLALSAAAITLLLAAPAALAKKVPCVVGTKAPKCHMWEAKVKFVADGDTLRPKVRKRKTWVKSTVRMTGIQAPELSSYSRAKGRRGNCLAVEAAEELERLVKRRTVRLVAMKGGSTTGGKRTRLRRTIQVQRGGKWIDPAMVLLQKGLVLFSPSGSEWAWNGTYSRLAQQAAVDGVGLFDPIACGKPGPSQDSPLSLKVKWDGEGRDTPNSEWVRIKNHDPVNAVSLAGWTLRDSHLRGQKMQSGYRFPPSASVPPDGSIIVRVGRGSNGAGTFHWGLGETIFENATGDRRQIGDGAYLFDPHSELRAHTQYPCRVACSEPLAGRVNVRARYLGREFEWITITNTSSGPISLDEYEIENVPWFYEFGPQDVLAPGEAVTLWINKPVPVPLDLPGPRVLVMPEPGLSLRGLTDFADSALFRSWGHSTAMLADGADAVTLRNPGGIPVQGACHTWGGFPCPRI